MSRIPLAALGLLLAAGAQVLPAQAPGRAPGGPPAGNGEVHGTVVDAASGSVIARASVAVRAKVGNALVAGSIASMEGAFRIQGLRPGTYVLRVTYIGFAPKVQDIAITDAAPSVNVGAIKLAHVSVQLGGVQVTEERAAVAIEADRNAYRAKDVAPAAVNASEVLDAVPSVQVDGEGKVSFRGNENVAVQINGRPSPIQGAQLGTYLKSLPANIIERIEVIPNPSAKYDPEGMAGIINIVLKQNTDLGYSGGANVGAANSQRFNGSGNVGYQAGAISSLTSIGFNRDGRNQLGINNRERFTALGAPMAYTDQDIGELNLNNGFNFNTNVDYKLSARDVFTNQLAVGRRTGDLSGLSAYEELNGSRAVLSTYGRMRDQGTTGLYFDYTSSMKRTFEARKHELSGEVRFNRSKDTDNTLLFRQPSLSSAPDQFERDQTDALTRQLTLQSDYLRTLDTRTKLESGYKGTERWLDRAFDVSKDSLGTGTFVASNLSNTFNFNETVHAVYGVLSHGVGNFEMQAGLRGEQASRTFSLAKPASSYPISYGSLFPSANVMYNMSDATQMKASYSRRIRRPGTQELNPFPTFFDVQNVFIGNPSLSPEYTDAIELGLTKNYSMGTLQLSPFYRHTSNVIRVVINTADTVDAREVTSVSFKNLAKSDSWGSDVNGTLRLGQAVNGFASFNVFKMVTDGGSTTAVGSDAVTWSTRLNATANISPSTTLQGSWFYRAPMKIERGEFAAFQQANFSVRQKLDASTTLSVRLNDPFNTGHFRVLAGDDHILQLTEKTFGIRAIFVNLQYTFGQTPKIRPPRQDDAPPPTSFP